MGWLDSLTEEQYRSLDSTQLEAVRSSIRCGEERCRGKYWYFTPEEELEKIAQENGWGKDWRNARSGSKYNRQTELEKHKRLAESSLSSVAYAKHQLCVKSLGINKFGISYKDNECNSGEHNIRLLAKEYELNPSWIIRTYLPKMGIYSEDASRNEFICKDFKIAIKAINAIDNLLEDIDKKKQEEKEELERIRLEENDKNLLKVDGVEIRVEEVNGIRTINIIKADNCNIKIDGEFVFTHTPEELSVIPIQIREQLKQSIKNIDCNHERNRVEFDIKIRNSTFSCVVGSVINEEYESKANLTIGNYLMLNKEKVNTNLKWSSFKYRVSEKDRDRVNSLWKIAKDKGFDFYDNNPGSSCSYYCLDVLIKDFNMNNVKEFLNMWVEFNIETENE